MLRSYPHGIDYGAVAGGDTDRLMSGLAKPQTLNANPRPPGEDGVRRGMNSQTGQVETYGSGSASNQIENQAQEVAEFPDGVDRGDAPPDIDFLDLVRKAEDQSYLYVAQVNRKMWSQSYRAFHNEHYIGSKYQRPDWRGRSKLFVPHTRAAVRKDNAAVAASLFNNIDAISCLPGNEGDARQRGAAAVMQELVNYRTDRTSGKAGFPWFLISMGARQDAVITGICCTKQSWKQEFRKVGEQSEMALDEMTGEVVEKRQSVYVQEIDRPDMQLIPPENVVMDVGATWTNPAQESAYFIIKWPMQLEEIRDKQRAPINPWKEVDDATLRGAVEAGKWDMAAIRRAREFGLDRLDETQTGTHFQVIWVYEVFMFVNGEDWTFFSLGDKTYLTDPKPTRKVYPAHFGERPIAFGYGNLESHRIYPQSAVDSWQPLQLETNDIRNLMLDATKQNVMPISKVRRGKQIDLDQVRRRSSGTSIIVSEPDDVTWESPPGIPPTAVEMSRELSLELDDLAGQQNYGSVETNNALGKTLGGLKLAAGAANAVQEFDIRLWLETWATPALSQIVQLEQFYEKDATVLGLAGQRAQLFEKHGINMIDDKLLEEQVTVRVSVGLGAGDPMQRLAKFESVAQVLQPILQMAPEFQSGVMEIDVEAIIQELFGAAGYKDGGSRFFKKNQQPRPNPMADLQSQMLQARIAKDQRTGQAAYFTGLAQLAKVALGKRELETEVVDRMMQSQMGQRQMQLDDQHRQRQQALDEEHRFRDQHLSAFEHGHRHGLALSDHAHGVHLDRAGHELDRAGHEHQVGMDRRAADREDAAHEHQVRQDEQARKDAAKQAKSGEQSGGRSGEQSGETQEPNTNDVLMQLLASGKLEFTRDPKTKRISGVRLARGGT